MPSLEDRPPPIVPGTAYIPGPSPPTPQPQSQPVRPSLDYTGHRSSSRTKRHKSKRRAASEELHTTPSSWSTPNLQSTLPSTPGPYAMGLGGYGGGGGLSGMGGGIGRAGGTPFAFQSPHLAPDDSISAAPAPQPMYASFAVPHAGPYPPPPPPPENHSRGLGAGVWPSVQDGHGAGGGAWDGFGTGAGGGAGAWDGFGAGQGAGGQSGQWDEHAMRWSPGSSSSQSQSQNGFGGFMPDALAQPALLATPAPYPPSPNPNPFYGPPHQHPHHHHSQPHPNPYDGQQTLSASSMTASSYPTAQQQGGVQQGYFATNYPPAAQLQPPPPPYHVGSRTGKTQRKLDTIIRSPGDFKDVAHRRFFDRPGSWRPDFRMPRSGLEAVFKKKGKTFSIAIQERHPSELSPKLRYTPFSTAPVTYDLRRPPSPVPGQTHFLFSSLHNRTPTPYDLAGFATEPPLPLMRLYHPRLPWWIDLVAADPVGVTLREVFDGIWNVLNSGVRESDYWNSEVEDEERGKINRAFEIRVGNDAFLRQGGVRKVDFLMRECIFLGLSKGREGMYEMRTKKI